MGKGLHYFKDGTKHRGAVHKMPNGQIHTGAKHTVSSRQVVHFGDLSDRAKQKARKRG